MPVARGEEKIYELFGYTPPSNFSALDAIPLYWEGGIPKGDPNRFRPGWEKDPVTGAYIKNYGQVDNGTAILDIVGYNDSTHVILYDISGTEPRIIETFVVNRMQHYNTTLPAKTYFKIVSDKPLYASMKGGGGYSFLPEWGGVSVFYPSTDGGFAGKEFIFLSDFSIAGAIVYTGGPGPTIYGIEDADVKVFDAEGNIIWQGNVKANQTLNQVKIPNNRRVYRIVSTGRIMFANWGAETFYTYVAIPSPMGGFIGKYFFGSQDAGGRAHSVNNKSFDAEGNIIWQGNVKANQTLNQVKIPNNRRVYRIVSTGRIMFANWGAETFYTYVAIPSPMGGFIGKYFFGSQDAGGRAVVATHYLIINQGRSSNVEFWETHRSGTLAPGLKAQTKALGPYEEWLLNRGVPDNYNVMIRSNEDVMIFTANANRSNPSLFTMGPGVTFTGVKAGIPTALHIITRGVAFSPEANAEVKAGYMTFYIPKGRYMELPRGLVTITSNATLVIEVMHYWTNALNLYVTPLIPSSAVTIVYPQPKKGGGILDIPLVAGLAIILIIVIVIVIRIRSKGSIKK
ncbi:hypothetical protein KEJ19_05030 [Candidatus Bathyarchaeota archaeon]|nr:hypothetical protein [Candidatus Bathyarchaeota archaeon]